MSALVRCLCSQCRGSGRLMTGAEYQAHVAGSKRRHPSNPEAIVASINEPTGSETETGNAKGT